MVGITFLVGQIHHPLLAYKDQLALGVLHVPPGVPPHYDQEQATAEYCPLSQLSYDLRMEARADLPDIDEQERLPFWETYQEYQRYEVQGMWNRPKNYVEKARKERSWRL